MKKLKTKKIYVSKRSIKEGIPGTMYSCPVALAINKAYKLETRGLNAKVGIRMAVEQGLKDYASPPIYIADVPRSVQRFVAKFDDTEVKRSSLKPFSFIFKIND